MLSQIAKSVALGVGGYMMARYFNQRMTEAKNSPSRSVVQFVEVDVPVTRAYNQWTQFEDFPQFMANIESVRQIDDKTLHWSALIAGKREEWDAEITEQLPDERIAWHSINGARNAGVVTFHKISDTRSRVTLQLDYEPRTTAEKVGDALLHAIENDTRASLESFKNFVEANGVETGAWRGAITQ